MKAKIVPTIFVTEQRVYEERLELYEGLVDRVQLDVADAGFTSQPSLSAEKLLAQASSIKRDVHLMVDEPIDQLEVCKESGAWLVVGQIEMMGNQKEFVDAGKELGLRVGLAVDLETEISELDWLTAKAGAQVLIMAVRAGKEGQKFSHKALDKVKWLRDKGYEGEICVDGGVKQETVKACVKAGADVLAIGSGIWQASDPEEALRELERLAETGSTG